MSNDGMVLTPSLVTVSEVFIASILYPPIITRLWSWPTVQTLEPHLSSVRVSGRVDQFSCAALHWVQLLLVSGFPPPQNRLPDWMWPFLPSAREGSSQVDLVQGRNNSADCHPPDPPVMRMAAKWEIHIHNYTLFNIVMECGLRGVWKLAVSGYIRG